MKTVTIKMPKKMHETAKTAAARNGRSLSGHIRVLITEDIKKGAK